VLCLIGLYQAPSSHVHAGGQAVVGVVERVNSPQAKQVTHESEQTLRCACQPALLADGFAWNGQTYDSLSRIAFAITGTRWNGPRFFGLRDKQAPRSEAER
jgi:DUF2924 family protein